MALTETAMDEDRPVSSGPPLNLTRDAYGYLVIGGGVSLAVLVLWNFPEGVQYFHLARLTVAFLIAVATGYLYQYVTTTWYDQFE
jgi:putative flippase GtrA